MIKTWPDDVLKKTCTEVTSFDDTLANTLDEMKVVLEEQKGLGLAANQIGATIRAFVIKLKNKDVIEVINPIILEEIGTQYEVEGCLSFPGINRQVSRPKYVHAKWQDRAGERKEAVFYDYEAVCFAHENDHLNGKSILDRVNRQMRKGILKEMGL